MLFLRKLMNTAASRRCLPEEKYMQMKLILPLIVLAILAAMPLEAADTSGGFSLGLGIETGQHTNAKSFDLGGVIQAGYRFGFRNFAWLGDTAPFEAGIKGLVAHDFIELLTVESEAFFRWYFFSLENSRLKNTLCTFFVQGDIGAAFLFLDSESIRIFKHLEYTDIDVMGGMTLGARFPIKSFFVEPYARFSYPGGFSFGVAGGYFFGGTK
jgi:hypothetical protein